MATIPGWNYFVDGESTFSRNLPVHLSLEAQNPGTGLEELGFNPFPLTHCFFHLWLRTHLTRLPGRHLSYLKPWLMCLELRNFWLQHLVGWLGRSMISWEQPLRAGINLKLPGLEDSRHPHTPRDFGDQVVTNDLFEGTGHGISTRCRKYLEVQKLYVLVRDVVFWFYHVEQEIARV